jgi:hypothetical protein
VVLGGRRGVQRHQSALPPLPPWYSTTPPPIWIPPAAPFDAFAMSSGVDSGHLAEIFALRVLVLCAWQ